MTPENQDTYYHFQRLKLTHHS